ncbi:hypothetical protein PC116_g24056 [Phytophthora cactorum]|uniref:Uncharacterized protein n=1 Tax=Phytophthora cactorum TaxID=29920 RepID=A0A8T1ACT5_9STRA|nr:hypothetical protein PC111_g23215 [Phytophthora cactorum]KAG2802924.1 hypothetical protein PC112_g19414 [Phytophthora cactorum]KAG2851381.1 hypothetical protein PC113_g15958 [Phytophthora cactorum]KAG2879217.1 hypothetical protein PC115_g22859 [Phytophthora cactorum]KAG2887587.1 hypothetical protein PC114_g18771 [Phytophthora cactorum]
MLEMSRVQNYPFSPDQQIQQPAWEEYICSLAKVVLQEPSPAGYVVLKSLKLFGLLFADPFVIAVQLAQGA